MLFDRHHVSNTSPVRHLAHQRIPPPLHQIPHDCITQRLPDDPLHVAERSLSPRRVLLLDFSGSAYGSCDRVTSSPPPTDTPPSDHRSIMNHHYNMNGLQAQNMPQPHLNGISSRREGQHDGQSLPSLSGAVPGYSPYSVGMSPHPSTSTASYPASSEPHYISSLPQLAPQQPHGLSMAPYSQSGGYASMSQSMMPPSSTSMVSHLPQASSARLPDLHPRPQDNNTLLAQLQQHGMQGSMLPPNQSPSEPEPTHVVGQQGRRGILPSAPGRAPGTVRSAVPVKDADGKYPCPHCNKTYQHAKHLKRHLLRRECLIRELPFPHC